MSLRFCFLASGSKGNCLYLESDGRALLIDCGISRRQVFLRMEAAGLKPSSLEAIVLTHEHGDHVRGVRVLSQKLGGLPVLATAATAAACRLDGPVAFETFEAGGRFQAAGMELTAFSLPHDAADPVGLVVANHSARLGVATDLGKPTALVKNRLAGCGALVLECNHDPGLLANGPYPPWLKQRVASRHGHLSNQQGAELLAELHHQGLRRVVLAHLSETNNTPALAAAGAADCLGRLDSRAALAVAGQYRPTEVMEI